MPPDMNAVWATMGAGGSAGISAQLPAEQGFGPVRTPGSPAPWSPSHPYGIQFLIGVGSIVLLVLLWHSLPR